MNVVSTGNAKHYRWGDQCDGWHLASTTQLSVIQERMPHGCAETRHRHELSQQFFYVLSGVATIETDGNVYRLAPRQGIHIPAGVPHQVANADETDLEFIVVSTPPSHGDRISA